MKFYIVLFLLIGNIIFGQNEIHPFVKGADISFSQQIEDLGGVLPAINAGFFQREISEAAYRYQREIDDQTRHIIGVNKHAEETPLSIPILEMDPEGYKRQADRLEKLRKKRDNGAVGQALDKLRIACQGTENTMPYIMEAVHAYATLGEIIDIMREEFGTYEEPTWI